MAYVNATHLGTDAEIDESTPNAVLDATGSQVERSRARIVVTALEKVEDIASGDVGTNRRDTDPDPAAGPGEKPAQIETV